MTEVDKSAVKKPAVVKTESEMDEEARMAKYNEARKVYQSELAREMDIPKNERVASDLMLDICVYLQCLCPKAANLIFDI